MDVGDAQALQHPRVGLAVTRFAVDTEHHVAEVARRHVCRGHVATFFCVEKTPRQIRSDDVTSNLTLWNIPFVFRELKESQKSVQSV